MRGPDTSSRRSQRALGRRRSDHASGVLPARERRRQARAPDHGTEGVAV